MIGSCRTLSGDRGQPKRLASSTLMLGKFSIIGAVAAIIMIPTALSAQMGGAVNPGVTVRGAVERGIPGPDLGTWRSPSGEIHRTRNDPPPLKWSDLRYVFDI